VSEDTGEDEAPRRKATILMAEAAEMQGDMCATMMILAGARSDHIKQFGSAAIAERALAALLHHSRHHVPHYRGPSCSPERFQDMPVLTRAIVQMQSARLTSDDLHQRCSAEVRTSGSTGQPVEVVQDYRFARWNFTADVYAAQSLLGMSYDNYMKKRRLAVWHRRSGQEFTQSATLQKSRGWEELLYIEPYEVLTADRMSDYLEVINGHRPSVILAYPGSLQLLARHARVLGVDMHSPELVISGGELLTDAMRREISEVFRCPVRNRYGAREVGRIAVECKLGRLHVLEFHNLVEVLDPSGQPLPEGEVGRIVVTSLHNYAMPLIRYDIGDTGRIGGGNCPCGSKLPFLEEVTGRSMHHLVREDGGLVRGGNFIVLLNREAWIRQFHILQTNVNEIHVEFIPMPGVAAPRSAVRELTRSMQLLMGRACRITWEETDRVPLSLAGKHIYVRSLVWEDQLTGAGEPDF